jgi:hypothetical protein
VPRSPRFLATVVEALHNDLRFAPANTKQRQMEAAEDLISQIESDRLYPMEFVVYRLTGYRPEGGSFDATVVGRALRRDLGILVQALSSQLDLPAHQERGEAIKLDTLATRLGVARRTIQRRRDEGLVLHWVRFEDGSRGLACFPDSLNRFLESSPIRRSGKWTRLGEAERAAVIETATRLAAESGLGLDAVATSIAADQGRARSTIRGVLLRHDRMAAEPIFTEHGPLSPRDAAVCQRAIGMGVPVAACGRHFGKSVSALHRAMNRARAQRLRALPLHWIDLPTFARSDANQVLLDTADVRINLGWPGAVLDLSEVESTTGTSGGPARQRMIVATHWLLARAAAAIDALSEQPTTGEIDTIETDLRWVGRIRAALVEQGLPATMTACEAWLGRSVSSLPQAQALGQLRACLRAGWKVVETLEPRMSNRLESRCVAAVDRMLATRNKPSRLRASAGHQPGDLQVRWPLRSLVAWPWLEPEDWWLSRRVHLDAACGQVLRQRWGLDGIAPSTIQAMADAADSTPTAMRRRLRGIEVRLRMNQTAAHRMMGSG